MTDEAAEIYARGRNSRTSSREAWERLKQLGTETDWDTRWLRDDVDTTRDLSRRYEHE